MVMGMFGRFDDARRLSDEAMRLATEFRGRATGAMYQVRSRLESLAGDYEAGERFIGEGYDDLVSLGNVVNSSTFAGYRARAFVPPREGRRGSSLVGRVSGADVE